MPKTFVLQTPLETLWRRWSTLQWSDELWLWVCDQHVPSKIFIFLGTSMSSLMTMAMHCPFHDHLHMPTLLSMVFLGPNLSEKYWFELLLCYYTSLYLLGSSLIPTGSEDLNLDPYGKKLDWFDHFHWDPTLVEITKFREEILATEVCIGPLLLISYFKLLLFLSKTLRWFWGLNLMWKWRIKV